MKLSSLLQQVADSLGIDSLELNEHGVLALQIDDDVVISLEPDPDEEICHLYSSLCRVPEDDEARAQLLEALMTANCFGKGTAGASFGLDDKNHEILLGRVFDPERTTSEELLPWITNMVEVIQIWRTRLQELGADAVDALPEQEEDTPSAYMIRA